MLITNYRKYLPILFLIIVVFAVIGTNFTPGTWLTGWDNLHPEFNFKLNIYRSIHAVWQEYQGLGLLGGMAHASDLPRQIFLWIMSFVLPASLIRYFYHFLMLLVGTLGVYKLTGFILKDKKDIFLINQIGLISGIFYLLNIGTAQYFYAPFEPFSTFWGFFPWEILVLLRYLEKPSRKNLIYLAIVNILSVPQAYVQTIFIVYMLCVCIILSINLIKHYSGKVLKKVLLILFTIIFINAFWLLPNIYFSLTHIYSTQVSMNNRMNNERFYEMNKKRGNIWDFIFLKGFNLDSQIESLSSGQEVYLMKTWRDYSSKPHYILIGCLIFITILVGLFKNQKYKSYLIGIFTLSVLTLLNDVPIISNINNIIRSFPLIGQMIRNPFTKFIVPAILVFSIGFGLGILYVYEYLDRGKTKYLNVLFFSLCVIVVIIYGFPVFQGQLISPKMRINIPVSYFQLFDFFRDKDKSGRIMNLPQDSFWGWGSYRWGSIGSGFLWYGIEQPILDRAFDVWNEHLEGYYWELIYALRKRDQKLFNQILDKYDVNYIIYDKSYNPSDINDIKSLYLQEELLINNNSIKKAGEFGSISIYQKINKSSNNDINLVGDIQSTIKGEKYSYIDLLYSKTGNYFEKLSNKSADIIFPFESLFTGRFQDENKFTVENQTNNIIFENNIPAGNYLLNYNPINLIETEIPVSIYAKKESGKIKFLFQIQDPKIFINEKEIDSRQLFEEYVITDSLNQENAGFFMSINNHDYLDVQTINNNYSFIGSSILMNNNLPNIISIYSKINSKTELLSVGDFLKAQDCSVEGKEKPREFDNGNNELTIRSKSTSTCTPYSKNIFQSDLNSLYEVYFQYKSKDDELPRYCLHSDLMNLCLNDRDKTKVSFSNEYRRYVDYFEANTGVYDIRSYSFILESGINKEKEIKYKDIQIKSFPFISSFILDSSSFKSDGNRQVNIRSDKDLRIKVAFPKVNNNYFINNLLQNNIYRRDPTIYNKLPGDYFIKEKIENNQKSLILYSKNYTLNYLFEQNHLPADMGYLIVAETKNINGFPLTIKIDTLKNKNTLLYTLLPKAGNYISNKFILPPTYPFDEGLKVQFTNDSLNSNPSVNEIRQLNIFPIPYRFLTSLKIEKDVNYQSSTTNYQPFSVSHPNPSLYKVEMNNETIKQLNNGSLILSQSFDSGWHAYSIKNQQLSIIDTLFPFWTGKELKDHVLVNNWENGWNLDNLTMEQFNNGTIIIVYLPQYLEYIGFVLFGAAILIVLFYPDTKFTTDHQSPTIN